MFMKRLKGLLAMVLAGSIATTAIPLSASATISGDIDVVDGGTVKPNDITCTSGDYSFGEPSHSVISGDLGSNNLWAINADKGGTESGYIITTAKGDELAEKLYGLKESSTEYENVKIKNSHKVLVTTADPSVTDTDVSGAANVSEFPHEISLSSVGFTPINNSLQEATWTVWYGAEFGNTVDSGNAYKGDSYAISSDKIKIPMSTVENIYKPVSGGSTIPFGHGVTIIQLQNSYKTFEIPVYNGWGEATNQKISVTETNTDSALKDLNGAALKGKYVLVYDETQYNNNSNYITNKDELWSVIGDVAAENGTFDVSKAKLVRYVKYNAVIGYFTSVDLLNEVEDNQDINYLNERKDSGSIWKLYCEVINPTGSYTYHKFVYGDSFDAEIKEFLNKYDCDTVYLSNKTELHITATDPSTKADQDGCIELESTNDVRQYITINTDKQYPVKVSDLAAKLTAEISPTAGMKYNKDEWELWPCYTSTGSITMDRKATVADPAADIGITHYELAPEQGRNDLLVYFKQIAIAPAVEVTAPVVGNAPSTEFTTTDNVGGYTVESVKWFDGETKLTASDTFAGGKQYTVKVTLKPDTGLQFIDDTKVTINGNAVSKTLNEDGTLTVSYTFARTAGNPGSGSGSGSSGSSSSTTPSYDPNKPMIDGEEKSWSDVAKDIENLGEGDTKTITLGNDKRIPADVIKAIKDSKAIITFNINSVFSWTVDGSTLTDGDIGDYDFSVELITATGTEILRGNIGTSFKIGNVTDKATLNIKLNKQYSQQFANLFKQIDGKLVFVDNVKIDENGKAIGLEVSESGEYVLMVGKFSDRPGDIDNNGELDARDAAAVLRDLIGLEKGANPEMADFNGDSELDARDAAAILRKLIS